MQTLAPSPPTAAGDSVQRLVRDCWRCSRCGESPRRGVQKGTNQRGLTCACRGYVLTRGQWWRMAALRDRLWVDLSGKSAEINRAYWAMPESRRVVYARIPNDQVELPPNGGSESKTGAVGG